MFFDIIPSFVACAICKPVNVNICISFFEWYANKNEKRKNVTNDELKLLIKEYLIENKKTVDVDVINKMNNDILECYNQWEKDQKKNK